MWLCLIVDCNITLKADITNIVQIWVTPKEASLYLGISPSFREDRCFFLFFLSKHQLLPTLWEKHSAFCIIAQQFPRPWHCFYNRLPELPQIIWIFLHPWTASPGSACLCKPAVQQPSLCLHFFLKKSRRFLLQYLVGNSKKRGTAAVFHRQKLRNPTSQRTSVFSSPDRKKKKTPHMTFSLALSTAS